MTILVLFISFNHLCLGQIKSMGLTPSFTLSYVFEKPKLKLLGDTLYVCSPTGIYKKNLQDDSDWKLYAFENIPVKDFVKNGNKLLAIKQHDLLQSVEYNLDSLLLFSNDNGQTFIDFTSPYFLERGGNSLFRIVQNPENPNSILVFDLNVGVSKSDDFGMSWKYLNQSFGYQNWDVAFHPLDTTTIFYTGESMIFYGLILKSSDNGDTWSSYRKDNNCFHSIAFHPTNPDILILSGEYTFAKSTDKGESWNMLPVEAKMYFYKVLFDEENPTILYSSGIARNPDNLTNDTIFLYRSTDMGDTWNLWYSEYIGEGGGYVFDMVKYKNKLIFYTDGYGLLKLDLGTSSNIHDFKIKDQPFLTIFPNPVQDILHFETNAIINSIEIIDLSGRIHQKISILNNERQIDISQLNQGIYTAVFNTKEQTIAKKIVVVK